MATLPHDLSDLYLAPVALALDQRLEEFGRLSDSELAVVIGIESDSPDYSRSEREQGVLRAVMHLTDLHGWTLTWDPRGLRLTHGIHTFVLGLPSNVQAYRESDEPA